MTTVLETRERQVVVRRIEQQPFDADLALIEVRSFERIAKLHLKRCNCPDTAKEISMILGKLAEGFANK